MLFGLKTCVVVCNINQIRKSFFAELGFYENDTLVRIMYEDFIKGTQADDISERNANDPKRTGFHEVRNVFLKHLIEYIDSFEIYVTLNI